MKFKDIPQRTSQGSYKINLEWTYLKEWIDNKTTRNNGLCKLDLNPDFQRGHVWTEKQQVEYIEFVLQGGVTSTGANILRFNCVGFQDDYVGPFVIVDGLQRLTSALRFLNNEIKAFNHYYNEFEDRLSSDIEFVVIINNLKTRKEVLKWYLEINTGGIIHSDSEIERVKQLLDNEI